MLQDISIDTAIINDSILDICTAPYFEIAWGQFYISTINIFGLVKLRVLDNLFVSKGLAAYSLDISYIFSMTWWWISLYGVKSEFFFLTSNREQTNATFSQYLKMSRICRTKQASCAASLTPSPPSRQLLPCLQTLTLFNTLPGHCLHWCCSVVVACNLYLADLCTGYREISDWCRPRCWCRPGAGGGHQAALRPAARPGAAPDTAPAQLGQVSAA